jgi:hypothetical protein
MNISQASIINSRPQKKLLDPNIISFGLAFEKILPGEIE